MTMQATNGAPIDSAWLAELTAELAGYGYKVTKTRATRASASTESAGRADGCAPAKARGKGHDNCAAHWRVPGLTRPVCVVREGLTIAENGRSTGELVGPDWTDTERVLAFAADVGARMPTGPAGYVGADQSGNVLPNDWHRATLVRAREQAA